MREPEQQVLFDERAHLLADLRLPSRYESLLQAVGDDVARLLVTPDDGTLRQAQAAALAVKARSRGAFAPVSAPTGTGKTTFASHLKHWLPAEFTSSAVHRGPVTNEALQETAGSILAAQTAAESRVIPLTIEDRESSPPTEVELAQLKGFLRTPEVGSRCLLLWPETNEQVAVQIGERFEATAGSVGFDLPLVIGGPPRETWPAIAIDTLQLVNGLSSLQELGVDPLTYEPEEFRAIGSFLDRVSGDFIKRIQDYLSATRVPIRLTIVFATGTNGPGILETFTGGRRFGLVEPQRLLAATPGSEIGRWWSKRSGLLTSVMYRLDTRVVSLPPSTAIPILRGLDDDKISQTLADVGINRRTEGEIVNYLGRSDLGHFLASTDSPFGENRGKASEVSPAAFDLLATEYGFGHGKDKALNRKVGTALSVFSDRHNFSFTSINVEKKLDKDVALIPDISLNAASLSVCLELHWRRGDYLTPTHRSEIAQYILRKVRSYGESLGWLEG